MGEYKKPLPLITPLSKVFYDGCRDRKLLYQKCSDCGEVVFFPRHLCSNCMSRNLAWQESKGRGRIHTFTVTYQYAPSEFADSTPYALAIIKLDEGFRLMSNLVDCDFDQLACEMPVEVVFEAVTDEITLPKFRLVAQGQSMQINLSEKTALVTGSSRGIGRTVASALAEAGADVVLTDVRPDTDDGSIGPGNTRVMFRTMDVADGDQIRAVVKEVQNLWGGPDILVNNAGVMGNFALLADQDAERFERDLKVNLSGAFLCARAVWPGMTAKGWGRIINISSITAVGGAYASPSYGASKAGLLGLTTSLALEGGRAGITVNAVLPGLIDTEPVRSHGTEIIAKVCQRIPIRRLGRAEEVANLVVFLASEQAGYINGASIPITGGLELLTL